MRQQIFLKSSESLFARMESENASVMSKKVSCERELASHSTIMLPILIEMSKNKRNWPNKNTNGSMFRKNRRVVEMKKKEEKRKEQWKRKTREAGKKNQLILSIGTSIIRKFQISALKWKAFFFLDKKWGNFIFAPRLATKNSFRQGFRLFLNGCAGSHYFFFVVLFIGSSLFCSINNREKIFFVKKYIDWKKMRWKGLHFHADVGY